MGVAQIWHWLALAGIGKQLLEFFNGINHGITAHNFSAAYQYHAVLVESFMVLVIAPGQKSS
ncbi:MAG: hypothetical protein AB2688_10075 [Candidatus Thiodiazotropha taylori]|nr:hypothetical protein [Candidatus Thiodiazotropha taylori]MCG8040391.1 hypothetical protein [Candidatus Thiodiazotropha taylori]MCG8050505.1 hypothetical protein [Candidatus Thiodiazotropha taylori]MCW4241768.1 hypothetical protein [Candidatus Thiodiazotropha taylori]MCW4312324.1 hypothetical protein [Candidatus Thiodiazotropha taylori]